jgi:hypothetical protein
MVAIDGWQFRRGGTSLGLGGDGWAYCRGDIHSDSPDVVGHGTGHEEKTPQRRTRLTACPRVRVTQQTPDF